MQKDPLAQDPLERLDAALKAPIRPKEEIEEEPAPDSWEGRCAAYKRDYKAFVKQLNTIAKAEDIPALMALLDAAPRHPLGNPPQRLVYWPDVAVSVPVGKAILANYGAGVLPAAFLAGGMGLVSAPLRRELIRAIPPADEIDLADGMKWGRFFIYVEAAVAHVRSIDKLCSYDDSLRAGHWRTIRREFIEAGRADLVPRLDAEMGLSFVDFMNVEDIQGIVDADRQHRHLGVHSVIQVYMRLLDLGAHLMKEPSVLLNEVRDRLHGFIRNVSLDDSHWLSNRLAGFVAGLPRREKVASGSIEAGIREIESLGPLLLGRTMLEHPLAAFKLPGIAVREFSRLRRAEPEWFADEGQVHINYLVNEALASKRPGPGIRTLISEMVAAGMHAEISRLHADIEPSRRAAYEAAVMQYAAAKTDPLATPARSRKSRRA